MYTILSLQTDVGTKECTQIDEDGLLVPFCDIHVHCCNASRSLNCDACCNVSYNMNCETGCDMNCVGWREYISRYGVPVAPLSGRLFLGRENRFYATDSAVRRRR